MDGFFPRSLLEKEEKRKRKHIFGLFPAKYKLRETRQKRFHACIFAGSVIDW